MDLLKQCVILALVLLEAVTCAENVQCGIGNANCHVFSGGIEFIGLECGDEILKNNHKPKTEEALGKWSMRSLQKFNSYLPGFPRFKNTTDNEKSVVLVKNKQINESLNVCRDKNATCRNSPNSTSINLHENTVRLNISKEDSETELGIGNGSESKSSHLPKLTTLQIHLLGSTHVIDISPFSYVNTVIIQTYGYDLFKICGTANVSDLTVRLSYYNVKDIKFIESFNNLRHLNLSHNNITTIAISELPPSVVSIDLSYNGITFYKNCSLPLNLRVLNISYNSMTITDAAVLKGNVIVLDARSNRLARVPVIEMTALEELYLRKNNIPTLKEETFVNMTNLTTLDLRQNCLNNLDEKVFQSLNKLQRLDLSENNLVSLAPATFQFLNNLVILLLSNNINLGNLQNVEDASLLFGTGQRLQIIVASGTNLSRIPSTLTRSVRKLLLADNKICTIQCGELESFPLLQALDVSNNILTDIEEDALGRLEFLTDLRISSNKLISVPKSLPNQLQVLDLSCNEIDKLNNIDLLGLQKLRVLYLSRNIITFVEDGAFGQLSSLDVLDLSYNPIKSLYRSSFTGPRRLKELYLISLRNLIPVKEPLSFPAPESAHLEVLKLDSSPELATQLMDDVAALTMLHEVYELSLNNCNLSTLRSDLPIYLPRLHKLDITGNSFNCTDIVWLIEWLQSSNISMQYPDKIRHNIIRKSHKCYEDILVREDLDKKKEVCASSEALAGKAIISLKEEDSPEPSHKTTSPLVTQLELSTSKALMSTRVNLSKDRSAVYTTTPSSSSYEVSTTNNMSTKMNLEGTPEPLRKNTVKEFKSPLPIHSKLAKSGNSINKPTKVWKYLGNRSKQENPPSDTLVILINDTKHTIKDIDNQINGSISSGAFQGQEPTPTSHPGMVVFLFVIGVIVSAASVMVYSYCSQVRRSTQYHHHQDIEVSSFGGNELW